MKNVGRYISYLQPPRVEADRDSSVASGAGRHVVSIGPAFAEAAVIVH